MNKILLVGDGAFSKALYKVLTENEENELTMWSPNTHFKKKKLNMTYALEEAIQNNDFIFILVSTPYLEKILEQVLKNDLTNKILLVGTKGLLLKKPYFISEYLDNKKIAYSIFGGPNLAKELEKMSPTSITFSTNSLVRKSEISSLWPSFIKPIFITKAISLEICNNLKNIYAIGAGMINSLYPFQNTHFTYLNEVIKELQSLLGEDIYPFLGDLLLTCSMNDSRNFTYGTLMNEESKRKKYLLKNTVEGLANLETINFILKNKKITLPIFEGIYESLSLNKVSDKLKEAIFHN